MNNSTATQQNNQPKQDAWGLAYEASRVAKIVNKSAYAIRANIFFNVYKSNKLYVTTRAFAPFFNLMP